MQKIQGYTYALFALAAAGGTPARAQNAELTERTDPRIESIAQSIAGTKTPGLGLLVIHKGQVVHAKTYGVSNVVTRAPFTLQTPTYIASLAKMFTAHAILQQVDQGKLQLDAHVGTILPEVPAYARNVTIRQLLTHTSGLVDHLDIGGEDRQYSYGDVIRILDDADSLLFAPQSRSSYSNSAYILLAAVLEKVSDTSFEKYLAAKFFQPLRMNTSTVVTATSHLPRDRARGYAADSAGFRLNDYEASSTKGAGGTYASLADMHHWAMALRSGSLLSDSLRTTAATAAVRTNGRLTPWGMGWLAEYHGARDPLNGRRYVAATGNLRGFSGLLKWYQQEDLIIVWLANANSPEVFDALHPIARMLLLSE
jgi:CubicO group peptidase (beta-lactamase class C family)